jgi:hypothetical protein
LSPAEIVRKVFLKLRLPPYVTPGEKEKKLEKPEN